MGRIKIKHLYKSYGEQIVLKDLNGEFIKHKFTGIMGQSGAGKTTLLRILLGLEKADRGSVNGLEKESWSVMFQENRLCEDFDAYHNLDLVLIRKETRSRMTEAFKSVGLNEEELNKPVKSFSGGMKRRVALVRAMMKDAQIVVLDEPFKGLDEETKLLAMEYVKKQGHGKTVLLVTHDMNEVEFFDADLIRIEDGMVVSNGLFGDKKTITE